MSEDFVYIEDLAQHVGRRVTVRGWLTHKRAAGKKIKFLIVRDGSGVLQCIAFHKDVSDEVMQLCDGIPQESSLVVSGVVREDDRAPGGFELSLDGVRVLHAAEDYPIQPKEHGVEFLLDHRHLHLRSSKPQAVLRIRNEILKGIRDFFYDRGFVLIDSPILTPAACEGTTTLFETDYFGEKAYLAQSGQLYLEPACMALGRVYCLGPTFRAEKSKTRRHLTEFWMCEPEVAFLELPGLIKLAEDFIGALVARVLDRSAEQLKVLERDTAKLESITGPFPQLTYDEAAKILARPDLQKKMEEAGAPLFRYGSDLGGLDETLLTEEFDKPVMITHWPAEIKAFYMQPDPEDPSKALCLDVIAPEGYGEIIGGSQRVHDHDLLLARIREHDLPVKAFQWYLDIRKYGTVPHSGFGLGVERFVTWVCGIAHLRDTIPYPRLIHRLYP